MKRPWRIYSGNVNNNASYPLRGAYVSRENALAALKKKVENGEARYDEDGICRSFPLGRILHVGHDGS